MNLEELKRILVETQRQIDEIHEREQPNIRLPFLMERLSELEWRLGQEEEAD